METFLAAGLTLKRCEIDDDATTGASEGLLLAMNGFGLATMARLATGSTSSSSSSSTSSSAIS